MSNHIKVKKTRKLTGYPTHSRPSLPVTQTPIPWLANCRHQDYIILLLGFISDINSQKWHEFGAPWAGVNFLKNSPIFENIIGAQKLDVSVIEYLIWIPLRKMLIFQICQSIFIELLKLFGHESFLLRFSLK